MYWFLQQRCFYLVISVVTDNIVGVVEKSYSEFGLFIDRTYSLLDTPNKMLNNRPNNCYYYERQNIFIFFFFHRIIT